MNFPITILPGDERMTYAAMYLKQKGGQMCGALDDIPETGYLICSLPFTKDQKTLNTSLPNVPSLSEFLGMLNSSHILVGGNLPSSVLSYCDGQGIGYYDLMTSPDFVAANARLTAEGLLISLLTHTSFSICDCTVLLAGYGHCGREIAEILRLFTNEIYVYDTSPDAIKTAQSHHFLTISEKDLRQPFHQVYQVNTIINASPVNPFDIQTWGRFSSDCHVFNIASTGLSLPDPLLKQLVSCPGIPGKYAPKTAGSMIARQICKHFKL